MLKTEKKGKRVWNTCYVKAEGEVQGMNGATCCGQRKEKGQYERKRINRK